MTLDELLAREAIRDLMAKYSTTGDRMKVVDFAGCFTVDGIIESEHEKPELSFKYRGREAICAWQTRWLERSAADVKVHEATFVRHHLTTCKIEMIKPDRARARTYWVAWTDIGPDHAGYYLDEFRIEEGEWRISHRQVREDWRSGQSLFNGAISNSR